MKKYKLMLNVSDEIEAKTENEAKDIFWDRFDNSVWKVDVEEIKE